MSRMKEAYAARIRDGAIIEDPAQAQALTALDRVLRELAAPEERGFLGRTKGRPPVRGLYLWGGVGRGKSMLMALFVAEADVPKRRVHFPAFMQEVQAALHEVRKTGVDDALKPVADDIATVRLLALDEMQVTDIADAMILGRLFQRLFDKGVGVVTTSNRPPRDLYKDGLNRPLFEPFIDLIEARMEVLHLESETDHRQGRLSGGEVWLSPANAEARQRIDAIFCDLAGPDPHPLTLKVKGRDVTLPAFGSGVGRARFWELCGTALGPADYLAIAGAVRVLVLEDIPRLGRSNFNEAKRFVTLIDALYEAKVRLVASAADAPESLYIEGEGAFEFARTASRLREMMSDGWGA